MSEHSIRKLKQRFVAISMMSLMLTMVFISGLIYVGNRYINREIIRSTLNHIIENGGDLISWKAEEAETEDTDPDSTYIRFLEEIFDTNKNYQSPEFKDSTRYFAILFNQDHVITEIKTSHINAVSDEEAEVYGEHALKRRRSFGRYGNYYYMTRYYPDGSGIIVYLDSANVLQSNTRLLYLALIFIAFGIIVAFTIVTILSSKAIRSEVRNAEIQRQFMTDASHELKTPLAVIRANTEMQEILSGENEWTQSTLRQIDRMNGLIRNLVMISRAEENNTHEEASNVDVTQAIRETVENFQPVAMSNGKILEAKLDENVHIHAENAQIRQLCSLLVDNAIKYCDDGGNILVTLQKRGRSGILLAVENDYAAGANVDYTKFFERFYREDESHNIDKGGYGIGLSIAESLVKQYHGTINASWKQGRIRFACVLRSV